MSLFRGLLLAACCALVPAPVQAVGPEADPQSKLTPAMQRSLDHEAGPYRVWVFFTDKGFRDRGAREAAVASVADSYDAHAVERRRRRSRSAREGGPLFDERDLPVYEPYVDRVVATGARVRIRSRWVNAVSVEATGPQVRATAALPMVSHVQPVARSKRTEVVDVHPAQAPALRSGSALIDYGRSTDQLTQINLIALHDAGFTGQGVIVGVLDTGFRRDHEAFHQPGHDIQVVAEYDFINDDPNAGPDPADHPNQHDHGTLILGTLGSYYPGELVGGAYGASFALAKTEDITSETMVEEDYYVAGLEFLEMNGADMTTSSLGYIDWYTQADLDGQTAVTTIAINTAGDLGVHTVTAAGNDGNDADPATSHLLAPADAYLVITAGAVDASGNTTAFSSDGPTADGRVKPELLALGSSTQTISPYDTTGYTDASGTSLSTPLVAGALACLIEAHPDLTPQEMREALFVSADYAPGSLAFDPIYVRGYGIVDALTTQINAYVPAGSVFFESDAVSCNGVLVITLRDDNIPGGPDTVDVMLSSDTETFPEIVTLTRIEPGIDRFRASFPTTSAPPANGDGALSVTGGEVVYVDYVDADDGAGGFNVAVQDMANTDCQPPLISAVQVSEVTGATARITWATDEPADSAVTFGLTPPGSTTETDPALVTAHDLRIGGLQECSPYVYSVASSDAVGNLETDDNGGAYHTLQTGRDDIGSYDSTDTPRAIQDFITFDSVIAVPDSKPVQDVNVTVDITHTFVGDIYIDLIPPTGTAIRLVDRRGADGQDFENTVFDDEAATSIVDGTAPFAGSYRPEGALSAADGIDAAGDWTLRVGDGALAYEGTLDSWTLMLTFPGLICGPHASAGAESRESDSCASGGPSDANGRWDAGESVTFGVPLTNDGTEDLTGVWAELTPLTPGVTMLDAQASYPDLPMGASAGSLAPHFAASLAQGLTCGEPIEFEVTVHADQGSASGGTVSAVAGEIIPGGAVALFEDFDAGLPGTWTVVDGFGDAWSWYVDNATDPQGCTNIDPQPPIAGNWMTVDSDCTGPGTALDEELISPQIDLAAAVTASVEFDHYYNDNQDELAEVDVRSSLTAGQWVNVAVWTTDTANPEHAVVDITEQAAGASDVELRWHYSNADFEWYWYVDNVSVAYSAPGSCEMALCGAAPTAPPPVPDGTGGGQPLEVGRSGPGGSPLVVSWDDQCSPVTAKILYGPLGGVGSYTVAGAECGIAQPHVWDPVPAGDLWFLVISEDGAGVEGSWGFAAPLVERNGLTTSGTCGSTSKDLSATCP